MKDYSLCIAKADKGNSVVVMDQFTYDRKIFDFINDNNGSIVNFNFSRFSYSVRKAIVKSEYVIEPCEKRFLISTNPIPPRLYGSLKVHKTNIPIRPVVSYVSSPTYGLCKHLNRWFKKCTNFRAAFSVQNTTELIDKIENASSPPGSIVLQHSSRSYPQPYPGDPPSLASLSSSSE